MISELQIRIIKIKVFTKIDIRETYYRIQIKKSKKWKTAFKTRYKYYKYIIMLFSLINAPATIQILVNDILKKYLNRFYIAYLNDILIYSNYIEDYKKHVKLVLKVL